MAASSALYRIHLQLSIWGDKVILFKIQQVMRLGNPDRPKFI
jgi:hypothetical protein